MPNSLQYLQLSLLAFIHDISHTRSAPPESDFPLAHHVRSSDHKIEVAFWLWLIPLLLLTTWMGARSLNADLLFVDEYWSVFKSGGAPYGPADPFEILYRITGVDPGGMGALYYFSLGAWEALIGASAATVPFIARLYSLLVGLLAIACTFRVGKLLFPGTRIGFYAACVMGTSAFFIDYLHEARAYTQFALFTALMIWAYWALISHLRKPRLFHYQALTLALVGLAYTHYVALSVAVVIGVYHLIFVKKDARWFKAVGAMIVAALLYLLWIPVLLEVVRRGMGDTNRQQTSMLAGDAIETLLHAFSNGGGLALWLLLALSALLALRRTYHQPSIFVWCWALGGLAVALLVNAAVPFLVHLRYLMFLWPALALVTAMGVHAVARHGLRPALVLGVWMTLGVWQSFQPSFIQNLFGQIYRAPKAGINRSLGVLRDQASTDDLVLFHIAQPGYEPFQLFILDFLMRDANIPGHYDQIERVNNSFALDDNSYINDIAATLAAPQRIWTLTVPDITTTQRTVVVDYLLSQTHTVCGTPINRPDARLTLYHRLPENVDTARQRMPLTFGTTETGRIRAQLLRPIQPDTPSTLPITLAWSTNSRLDTAAYSVALHLDEQNGGLARQVDLPLASGAYRCQYAELPLNDLPAGDYSLHVIVYNWASGERLSVVDTSDNRAFVGSIIIP